jgi:hypothetical protein
MRKTFIAIAAAAMLASSGAWADDFPFVGKWNCEVSDFTFTNRTYSIGSEKPQSMLKIEKFGSDYRLGFAEGD